AVLQTTQLEYALLLEATGLPEGLPGLDLALLTKADVGETIGLFFSQEFEGAMSAGGSRGATFVGSMNRAQQAYYLENNAFASQLNDLGIGIDAETDGYQIEVAYVGGDYVVNTAIAQDSDLDSFLGIVYRTRVRDRDSNSDGLISAAILCRTPNSFTELPFIPPLPTTIGIEMRCPAGFEPV
ncbi:MAG: type IV pilin-like G/H family protein, partial [Cyanobacteria bacterium J06659_2]